MQLSQDHPTPMHIFDIRRSNSVTELWKRYETPVYDNIQHDDQKTDALAKEPAVGDHSEQEAASEVSNVSATSAPGDASEPLLVAFEAELAQILNSTENSETRAPQPETEAEPAAEPSTNTGSQRAPHPAELLAAQIMHHIVNGANMVQSELNSRLPELQRQVRNAQRSLPEHVSTSLQGLLATLEAQLRNAYNNLPDGGRQLAEDAIHAGRPVAENAADSLRSMACEFNEVGRTLFAAFENEFGRVGSQQPAGPSSDGLHPPPGASPTGPGNGTASSSTESHPVGSSAQEKDAPSTSSPPVVDPEMSKHAAYSYSSGQAGAHPGFAPPPPPPGSRSFPFPPLAPVLAPVPDPWGPPNSWRPWNGHRPPPPQGPPPYIHRHHHHHPPPHPPLPPYMKYPRHPWPPGWHPSPSRPTHSFMPPQPPPKDDSHDRNTARSPPATNATGNERIQVETTEKKTLFIGNVGFNVTERMIQDVFASRGLIVSVDLPVDSASGKHAGFGYLHFPSIHPALAALDALQGAHIDGHAINLELCDNTPIQSPVVGDPAINFPKADAGISQRSQASNSQDTIPGEHVASSKPEKQNNRRKSVTFQEPALPPKEDISPNPNDVEQINSPPLIDLTGDETASTSRAPQGGHDQLLNFNPELEMSRFPPVSQLEAQLLTKQRSSQALGSTGMTAQTPINPGLHRSRTVSSRAEDGNEAYSQPALRRSNTTMTAPSDSAPAGEPQGDPRLRHRKSDLQGATARSTAEADNWARLVRRERNRRRSRAPMPKPLSPEEAKEAEIQNCVTSLIEMGYGTEEDGGRSRLSVYAAASNGSLLDAVEMIEEERKAYASHGR